MIFISSPVLKGNTNYQGLSIGYHRHCTAGMEKRNRFYTISTSNCSGVKMKFLVKLDILQMPRFDCLNL